MKISFVYNYNFSFIFLSAVEYILFLHYPSNVNTVLILNAAGISSAGIKGSALTTFHGTLIASNK